MLNAILDHQFYGIYVRLPHEDDPIPPEIEDNPKRNPFFNDTIGTIDGTHIQVKAPSENCAAFRDRKGNLSQNVLAACTFDMKFTYVLPGWEGSAADSMVFSNADLPVPQGRYYLADAGFPSCAALLTPYRGVRYHLKEWGASKVR
jgi:hypothetical protein